MKAYSEQSALLELRTTGAESIVQIYRACVAVANNGGTLPEEKNLGKHEKSLLEVRRLIYQRHLSQAHLILETCFPNEDLLIGDKTFLLGQVAHKMGDQDEAARLWYLSADYFRKCGDKHRELRARVNAAIGVATLESCLSGELFIFEQEARRHEFFDILANICRTSAIEFLRSGQLPEAIYQAQEAAKFYSIDGYRDDHAVSVIITAICYALEGHFDKAYEKRSEALIKEGKVKVYDEILEDLLNQRTPKAPQGHCLYGVKWKKTSLKKESIPGKIISFLKSGPKTRDEIITHIWGEGAVDQSYCGRFYSAINYLRKERSVLIEFDGSFYSLSGS